MSTIGFHYVFHVQLSNQKAQMKASLLQSRNRQHTLELSFSKEEALDLQWEGDDEFKWKGEMYDVIVKKTDKGRLVVTCISDKEEEKLLSNYLSTTERNQNGSKNSLTKFTLDNFVPSEVEQLPTYCSFLKRVFSETSTALLFRSNSIVIPPPKVC